MPRYKTPTLFNSKNFDSIVELLAGRASKYFAYDQPDDLKPDDMLQLFVPADLHQMARDVGQYYTYINKGGNVHLRLNGLNARITVQIPKSAVDWCMPELKQRDEDLDATANPTWHRIKAWAKWRIEQSHRWDGLRYAIGQMNVHLSDPRAALFYMPALGTIVDTIDMAEATRKRWDSAKHRKEPTEPLPYHVKLLASEGSALWTESMLLSETMPEPKPVRLVMNEYKHRTVPVTLLGDDHVGTIATQKIPAWSSNRAF